MTSEVNSLADAVRPFSESGYEGLFSTARKGGFLVYEESSRTWSVQKVEPKDKQAYCTQIIADLISTQDYRGIQNLDAFVRRLNTYQFADAQWNGSSSKADRIFFNSKSKTDAFLSNFYPTLILFRDYNNPALLRLYPSSENAYQAHKVVRILEKQKQEPKLYPEALDGDWSEILEQIATAAPLESKQLAANCIYIENSDGLAAMKYHLMHEIAIEKFRLNPVLRQFLVDSGKRELIENSSDRFWGAKEPNDPSLQQSYKLPIDMSSRNVLGRILMEVRANLI